MPDTQLSSTTRVSLPHQAIDSSAFFGEIIGWWEAALDELTSLCAELEDIADSLPDRINRQKCILAARALGPLMTKCHRFEENVLFPACEQRLGGKLDIAQTLERLKYEHFEDECFGEE